LTCQGVFKPNAMLNKVSLFMVILYSLTHYESHRALISLISISDLFATDW
jgi:hypothetical protein